MTRPSRLRMVLTAVAGLLAFGAGVAALQTKSPPSPPAQPGTGGQPVTPGPDDRGPRAGENITVDGAMTLMNRTLRRLRNQIADAGKKDDNLKLINDMQRGCVLAKSQPVPGDVLKGAKDDAARAELSAEFRSELIKAMRMFLNIEEDIAAGKTDSAVKRLEELVAIRDHAHAELGVDKE